MCANTNVKITLFFLFLHLFVINLVILRTIMKTNDFFIGFAFEHLMVLCGQGVDSGLLLYIMYAREKYCSTLVAGDADSPIL